MTDQEGETTGTPTTRTTADPRPAAIAMMVGNVIGAVGLILGFVRLSAGGAEASRPLTRSLIRLSVTRRPPEVG